MPRRPRSPKVRTGQGSVALNREEFAARVRERFADPRFGGVETQIEAVIEVAWRNYLDDRKSPRTRAAGRAFAVPEFQLPVEWLETRAPAPGRRAPRQAPRHAVSHPADLRSLAQRPDLPRRDVEDVPARARSRRRAIERARGFECDVLDLSRLASEYGRQIHPCKACVSTAMPLCHWPCSCYPNHALGQTNDWMAEIYERWVAAHGVMIVTPVYWYQAPRPASS